MNVTNHFANNIKIVRSLFRLNKNIVINSFKKSETWIRVVSIILIIYVLYQSAASGGVSAMVFNSFMHRSSVYYFPAVNIGLFVLFVLNIISPLFISSSKYSERIGGKLSYYPVSLQKIVMLGIIATTADLYNLIFVPFYIVAFYVISTMNSFYEIIVSLLVLLLFIVITGSIINLLKNLYLLAFADQRIKKVLSFLGVILLILLFVFAGNAKYFFANKENILIISNYIRYLPTGILAFFATGIKQSFFNNIAVYLAYFLIINILLYYANLIVQKKLKLRICKIGIKKVHKKESKLILLVKKHVTNPINKKDLIYSFRSTRELTNYLLLISTYALFAFYTFHEALLHEIKLTDIIFISLSFVVFHLVAILKYFDNFFGFDYGGVVNFFNKPIKYSELIKFKTNSFNFFILCNFILGTICLMFLKITWINYLFFTSFIIITYFILKPLCILLSIKFPYRIDFFGIQGMNVSFLTLIIVLISTVVLAGISYLLFKELGPLYKVFISCIFLIGSYFLFKSNNRINSSFTKLLINKKEKIISTCR